MALDQNDVTFATWADAEIAAGVAARTSLFEKIVQDLIVVKNLYNSTIDTPWRDSDIAEHFDADFAGNPRLTDGAGTTHDADGHYQQVANSSTTHGYFQTLATRRADRVPTILTVRVKVEEHSSNCSPTIGFAPAGNDDFYTTPPAAGAWFRRGTNSNTWMARTRSSSADQTTTDNIAGNYVGWDVLAIDFAAASVKFYVNGTLVATHTTNLPTSTAFRGVINMDGNASFDKWVRVDYIMWKQTTNPVSP